MILVAKQSDKIIEKGKFYEVYDYADNIVPNERMVLIPNSNTDSFVWYPIDYFDTITKVVKERIYEIKNNK